MNWPDRLVQLLLIVMAVSSTVTTLLHIATKDWGLAIDQATYLALAVWVLMLRHYLHVAMMALAEGNSKYLEMIIKADEEDSEGVQPPKKPGNPGQVGVEEEHW